jgi:hypothetical protein
MLQLDGNVDVYKIECNRMLKCNIKLYEFKILSHDGRSIETGSDKLYSRSIYVTRKI